MKSCRPGGVDVGGGRKAFHAVHRIGLIVPSSNTTMETELLGLLRERERERPEDRFESPALVRMQRVTPERRRATGTWFIRYWVPAAGAGGAQPLGCSPPGAARSCSHVEARQRRRRLWSAENK
jgi:hypothetical protein